MFEIPPLALLIVAILFAGLAVALTAQTKEIAKTAASTYALGPDDQIMINALDADEVSTKAPVRIDSRGNVNLPMVGRIHAAGLTPDQLEEVIETQLKKYVQSPDVSVYLVDMRSQPISVLGAVSQPGVHQLQGHKTLYEVISTAGGIRQDAGYQIKITRDLAWGRLPLPDAKDDPTGRFSVASVNIKSIMDASDPAENIEIKPNDVISVPKGELVYVIGAVRKPGGFVLGENQTLSTLKILSLSEGLDRFADTHHSKIIRTDPKSQARTEIPINLKAMLAGTTPDLPMQPNDLLFVPLSGKKAATVRGLETVLGMGASIGTGLAIYR